MDMDCNELALRIIVYLVSFEYQGRFILLYNYSDGTVICFISYSASIVCSNSLLTLLLIKSMVHF